MNKKAKSLLQATMLVAFTLSSIGAQARPGRWMDRQDDRLRNGEIVTLGEVVVGNSMHRVDASTLDIYGDPRLQCRLTHIKLSAYSDSVLVTRIDVGYRDSDRFGRNSDSIDLTNDRSSRFDNRREYGGIYLDNGQSSSWLDVDDVLDGHPDGRCIRSIRVYGIDTPDRDDRDRGRGGFGRGFDRGRGSVDNYRPASIRVEGLLSRPRHDSRPDMGSPRHEPRRDLQFSFLGTTGLVNKLRYDTRIVDVGMRKGRFDGIKLIAKDDSFEIKYVEVIFSNQERVRRENIQLQENDSYYLDFDDFRRGRGDRDRSIDQVIIYGGASNLFGSKAQIEVWGGR